MLNVSAISNASVIGRAIRLPLRLIPDDMQLRILQGPLRGKRWLAGASTHGCWLGSYECAMQQMIAAAVKPGMVCFDIGANAGFYTLLLSTLSGPRGRVAAFEPLSRNCAILRRHLALNGCANVLVRELAISDKDGTARFDPTQSNSQGHLAEAGSLSVRCARLDTLIAHQELLPPDVVKIDVEGAEAAILDGACEVLSRHKPVIFLATHGKHVHGECCQKLRRLDYELAPIGGAAIESCDEIVATPRSRD